MVYRFPIPPVVLLIVCGFLMFVVSHIMHVILIKEKHLIAFCS